MKTRIQLTKFIVVGVFATVVNYSTFWALLKVMGSSYYTLASALGFIAGVLAGYIPNKKWSFQSESQENSKIFKYFLVYATSLIISILTLRLLVEVIKVEVKFANFLAICLTTMVNFIGAKFFVFSNDTK